MVENAQDDNGILPPKQTVITVNSLLMKRTTRVTTDWSGHTAHSPFSVPKASAPRTGKRERGKRESGRQLKKEKLKMKEKEKLEQRKGETRK